MKFNMRYRKLTINIISLLFIVLFVYAAVSKLLDFETFTVQLAQSPLLSAYAGVIAWLVPGIEVAISILLLFERFRTLALYAAFTVMVMFTAYIYIILKFSDFVPCSCGGVLEKFSWTQHLIFNLVFILLSGVAIFLTAYGNIKIKVIRLLTLIIIGVGIVALLFAFSEHKMHRNNAFQRRYPAHPIQKIGEYKLSSNAYYIAGFLENSIYLGNYQAPLFLKSIDTSATKTNEYFVSISNMDLPFKRAKMIINGENIYLGDGTVPVIFKGDLKGKSLEIYSLDEAYFGQFVVADSSHIGISSISSKSGQMALGILKKSSNSPLQLNEGILKKQLDGVFDVDGILLWNSRHKNYIYTYYYRNSYEIASEDLQPIDSGRTIDTISKANLDIAHYSKKNLTKRGGKFIIVNGLAATGNDYLLINSNRLGKYDDAENLESAHIIDVYNIVEHSYEFSFYLYHQPLKALSDFKIYNNLLVAIVDDILWIYRLRLEYFNSSH